MVIFVVLTNLPIRESVLYRLVGGMRKEENQPEIEISNGFIWLSRKKVVTLHAEI